MHAEAGKPVDTNIPAHAMQWVLCGETQLRLGLQTSTDLYHACVEEAKDYCSCLLQSLKKIDNAILAMTKVRSALKRLQDRRPFGDSGELAKAKEELRCIIGKLSFVVLQYEGIYFRKMHESSIVETAGATAQRTMVFSHSTYRKAESSLDSLDELSEECRDIHMEMSNLKESAMTLASLIPSLTSTFTYESAPNMALAIHACLDIYSCLIKYRPDASAVRALWSAKLVLLTHPDSFFPFSCFTSDLVKKCNLYPKSVGFGDPVLPVVNLLYRLFRAQSLCFEIHTLIEAAVLKYYPLLANMLDTFYAAVSALVARSLNPSTDAHSASKATAACDITKAKPPMKFILSLLQKKSSSPVHAANEFLKNFAVEVTDGTEFFLLENTLLPYSSESLLDAWETYLQDLVSQGDLRHFGWFYDGWIALVISMGAVPITKKKHWGSLKATPRMLPSCLLCVDEE